MLFFWRHTAAYFQLQLNAILLATHSCILSVPVKLYSSGDTPLHTFRYSNMLIFWRHIAAYFQFQLNAILLATHRCILSGTVKCYSSGDTPLHTFSYSCMLIFWRYIAAYFQFQLNVIPILLMWDICHNLHSTISTRLHGVTVQNIISFTDTAMKT